MSSPIHSFLFSPPPSPPRRGTDSDPNSGFTSLKSLLLPTEFIPRSPHADGGLKPRSNSRSPRTPQQSKFTLDNVYPTSFPSRAKLQDPESTPQLVVSAPSTPRRRPSEKVIASPSYVPQNVPSSPLPIPSTLPKPLIRLLLLVSLLASSIMLLVFVPSARLPSFRSASMSRRLAIHPNGRAYIEVEPVTGWEDARDKDYRPPQIRASHMLRRAIEEKSVPAPHPRTSRPALEKRPLPATHELFALQSYLLSSAYNVLPHDVDPAQPLDANAVLGFGSHKLGPSGGSVEQAWLDEVKQERQDEVIIWYGANGQHRLPHEVMDVISAAHGSGRKPTLISCHGRTDRPALISIFERLSLPLRDHPIIMIGNEPVVGNLDNLEELKNSGRLETMLAKIGWKPEEKSDWKPRYAVVKKRELNEMEEALRAEAEAEEEVEIEEI